MNYEQIARILHQSAPFSPGLLIQRGFVEEPGMTLCSWLALSGFRTDLSRPEFRKLVQYAG